MSAEEFQRFSEGVVASPWRSGRGFTADALALERQGSNLQQVCRLLRQVLAEAWGACGAYEWAAFTYLGASSFLIALFAKNLAHPGKLLGVQATVAMLILVLCRGQARSAAHADKRGTSFYSAWWHFWRHWYPHLFFLFCFEELAYLVKLVVREWQDAKLIAFDHWLTGVHPAVWFEQFATPVRNEFVQLIYLTYFTYLLILGGILYFRREWQAYWSVMTYSMVGYSIGYLIAVLFPIESPWFAMAGWWKAPLAGGPVTATVYFIEHFGRVRGAAFPSEHVAGAVAALWGAWKYRRWFFWVLLPVVSLMCFSTLWGRYHYAADIFGGIITGTLGYFIGDQMMKRKGAVPTDPGAAVL
jgi:membrane-associated phospholipid phosphatase